MAGRLVGGLMAPPVVWLILLPQAGPLPCHTTFTGRDTPPRSLDAGDAAARSLTHKRAGKVTRRALLEPRKSHLSNRSTGREFVGIGESSPYQFGHIRFRAGPIRHRPLIALWPVWSLVGGVGDGVGVIKRPVAPDRESRRCTFQFPIGRCSSSPP